MVEVAVAGADAIEVSVAGAAAVVEVSVTGAAEPEDAVEVSFMGAGADVVALSVAPASDPVRGAAAAVPAASVVRPDALTSAATFD